MQRDVGGLDGNPLVGVDPDDDDPSPEYTTGPGTYLEIDPSTGSYIFGTRYKENGGTPTPSCEGSIKRINGVNLPWCKFNLKDARDYYLINKKCDNINLINFSSGKSFAISELASIVNQIFNKKININYQIKKKLAVIKIKEILFRIKN